MRQRLRVPLRTPSVYLVREVHTETDAAQMFIVVKCTAVTYNQLSLPMIRVIDTRYCAIQIYTSGTFVMYNMSSLNMYL